VLAPVLAAALNSAFHAGAVPQAVNHSLVTAGFKRGDPADTANYRPIAVTEPIMRLYADILNRRLLTFTENSYLQADRFLAWSIDYSSAVCLTQHMIDIHRTADMRVSWI
jgi:hypothetical protein